MPNQPADVCSKQLQTKFKEPNVHLNQSPTTATISYSQITQTTINTSRYSEKLFLLLLESFY